MHTDPNKMKLTLVYILVVLILIFVWTELLVGEGSWNSDFNPIVLPNITSQNKVSEGIASATLSLNGDVEISADNSPAAQLSSDGHTLDTQYKLTFDGDGTPPKSGGTDTNYQTYDEFLKDAVQVRYVTDDNDVVVTLHVKASNYPNDLADAGTYAALQTLTVHWAGP